MSELVGVLRVMRCAEAWPEPAGPGSQGAGCWVTPRKRLSGSPARNRSHQVGKEKKEKEVNEGEKTSGRR
jgi:hypothetical protein